MASRENIDFVKPPESLWTKLKLCWVWVQPKQSNQRLIKLMSCGASRCRLYHWREKEVQAVTPQTCWCRKDLGYTCSHHLWYSSHAALRQNFIIISRREDHTQKLHEDQIPVESYSSYASPIIVKEIANNCKKEKGESIRYRLCRDYRKQESRLRDDLPLTKLRNS